MTVQTLDRELVTSPASPRTITNTLVSLTFEDALNVAVLAISNVDRALRHQPPVTRIDELHHAIVARCRAAVLEATLAQHPAALLEAVNDAGDALFELVNQALCEPGAAIANDDELLKDAARAWFRASFTTYRETLAAQLSVLRSPDTCTEAQQLELSRDGVTAGN